MTQEITDAMDTIKKNLKTDKLVIGLERTLKLMRQGKIAKVFLASNIAEDTEEDFRYYSGMSGTDIIKLELPNDELGTYAKKTFSISAIGLLK